LIRGRQDMAKVFGTALIQGTSVHSPWGGTWESLGKLPANGTRCHPEIQEIVNVKPEERPCCEIR